ncbi:sensor histidine kinase [Paenibacillus sp. IHBB 10380]|uniref:sensor histidine kinase n=1 Tax=Paenibacillus sp. IHBB 10380 TaxID=1566358 RepID=UPI0005CFECE6|nr:ATP-binding protein [Paenibacillus sp. IHBB 10380]AJS58438.1 histidine kinase [Paenibacillus sp. IHBB 10380]
MIKGLHARLATSFIIIASTVLVIASIVIMLEIHYHFQMFQSESSITNKMNVINYHLERAMLESILWTALGAIMFVFIVSYFVAKKISQPLIQMRQVAERMSKGKWDARIHVDGNDEISELATSFNHLAHQLQQQEVVRRNMSADIAHELRTPLATLKSHMEAFEDGIWEPTPSRLNSCTEEINRLIHLISDLEQLNNLESPDFKIRLKNGDFKDVVTQSVDSVKEAFIQKNIKLEISDIEHTILYMDQERMVQVLINLLTNSLKYTNSGGKVSVSFKTRDQVLLVLVKDNGVGMKEENLLKVFDRLYREDPSRSRSSGGSGIGLAIVKRLVEAHKEQVWIDSKENEGTTVFVQLPKT